MQERLPPRVLLQVFGHMFREKNVTGVSTVHDPLSHVDASAGYVGLLVQITDLVNRTTVNPHPHPKFWMILECPGNLHRASNWRFRTDAENKCAAITGRQ